MNTYTSIPPGNYWAAVKQFYARGGFVNGLNPAVVGRIWYVSGNTDSTKGTVGSDSNDGRSPLTPLLTMARAFELIDSFDVIVLSGVINEQLTSPQDVFDITIIGAGNRPRQCTDGGVYTGGGASWLAPSSPAATTPLLKIREQGWTLANFQMAPVAASACVRLSRAETAVDMDGSHATFSGMYMVGGGAVGYGIEDVGGCSHVLVDNCEFQSLSGGALQGVSTGIAVPLAWVIRNNKFQQNLNDVKMSLSYGVIRENQFLTAGSGAVNKIVSTTAVAVQGGDNQVLLNQFSNTEAQIAPGSGYTGAASDTWMNYVNDQAALAFGQPA